MVDSNEWEDPSALVKRQIREEQQRQTEGSLGKQLAERMINKEPEPKLVKEVPTKISKKSFIQRLGRFKPQRKKGISVGTREKRTLRLLRAMGIRELRQGTPIQRLQKLRQLKQMKQQQRMSNYNKKDIVSRYRNQQKMKKKLNAIQNSQLSANTQMMMEQIQAIQNKGFRDNQTMQRQIRERQILQDTMNLTKAHENMVNVKLDFTGVNSDNILNSPSIFKENPENNILRTKSSNILSTKRDGNDLKFF